MQIDIPVLSEYKDKGNTGTTKQRGRPSDAPCASLRRCPPAGPSAEPAGRPRLQEINSDVFMLVHERDENPIDIKLLLHYRPDQRRIGIFTDSMFSVIIGFNVKGHRATSPPNKFRDLRTSRGRPAELRTSAAQKTSRRAPCFHIPFNMNVHALNGLVNIRKSISANYTIGIREMLSVLQPKTEFCRKI